MKIKLYKKSLAKLFSCSLVFFFVSFSIVHAATLSFSPSSGSYTVGEQFRVRVLVSSTDEKMNAAGATIFFSPKDLVLVSTSDSNSIIDFWGEKPTFNNNTGRAEFEGLALDGFQGSKGELVTLIFRAKSPGETTVRFSSGSVLAYDGSGTSILEGLENARFTIRTPTFPPTELPLREEEPKDVSIPSVSSPTHPDEKHWYSNNNPIFTWVLPSGVIDVDVVTSRDGRPIYDDTSKGLIDRFVLTDVSDGTHFIHTIFKTADGWGDPGTFQFNVDTESPESFTVQEVYRSLEAHGRTAFLFEAQDKTSGIQHYIVTINGNFIENWVDDGTHTYETPFLSGGTYTLRVEAVDRAGNATQREFVFTIPEAAPYQLQLHDYIGAALTVLLLLLTIFIYSRYHLFRKRCQTLLDARGIERHLRQDKKLQERLETEMEFVENLKQELSEVEDRLKRVHKEIKKKPKSK